MVLCVCPNPSVDKYVWLDNFEEKESNRILKEKNYPGGKGIHVAMALRELGESVCLLGFWGGPTGMWIKQQCLKQGIDCHGPETDEWTRTCITFKMEGKYSDTELLGTGPQISDATLNQFVSTFRKLIPEVACIIMSGSWPHHAPENAYAQLIEIANLAGKKSFLDASGTQLKNALSKHPFTIHINKKEGLALDMGNTPSDIAFALSQYCQFAAVTAGAEGLFYAGNIERFHARCDIKKVYSAVGSGDCLTAGLAFGYLKGMNTKDTAAMGVACGAANCLREDLGMLYRSDVEALFPKAVIKTF